MESSFTDPTESEPNNKHNLRKRNHMNSNDSGRRMKTGARKKPGCHGDHWDCVTQSEDEIFQAVDRALQGAKTPETLERDGHEVTAYIPESCSLTVCGITLDRSVCTVYPMALDGVVHEVTVDGIEEWENGLEGQVVGSIGPAALAFFDTRYYRNAGRYLVGERYPVALAAFAYSLQEEAEPRMITDPEGKKHSTQNVAGYRPFPRGDSDDFVYQFPVKSVETVRLCGKIVYRLMVPLFRLSDENGDYCDVDITLYAAEHVTGGYVPRVGDAITGVLWLQGHLSSR